ncbi:meiosis regulator and mRNA stability factor 1 isoform X1 [Halyomorpha halys]|uniref:meiosis regulator and mRNA stability factor 1 isoform X1 n=1 Tax=Halyomorpha halys TaxID=286706 RepID=UPI0006D4EB4E|nr:meiosis regulator and mRNA stability factor 1 isoform X1 [Halyomorpha halys]
MTMYETMYQTKKVARKLFPSEGVKSNNFKFPPPPPIPPIVTSIKDNESSDSYSDSNSVSGVISREKTYSKLNTICQKRVDLDPGYRSDGSPQRLPPIGVFWDIENCQIPHGKSAVLVVQAIRERFFSGYREAEFVVVCDVKKENPTIIQELNDAQVNLIHVASTSKNAADEKLRQSMRRFADIHGFPAAVVLVSGDINFASDLCDLRHRKKLHIILLYSTACSFPLLLCAHEHYNFDQFVLPLPPRCATKSWKNSPMEVMIWNLPKGFPVGKLKEKLKFMSCNCGGRITFISGRMAVVRFPSFDLAVRAYKRMNGEIMFGNQIGVSYPQRAGTLKKETNYFNSKSRNGNSQYDNDRNSFKNEPSYNSLFDGNQVNKCTPKLPDIANSFGNSDVERSWIWSQPKLNNSLKSNGTTPNKFDEKVDEHKQESVVVDTGSDTTKELEIKGSYPINLNGNTEFKKMKENVSHEGTESSWPSKTNGVSRKCRTPSPYLIKPKPFSTVYSQGRNSIPEINDNEKYFNPIQAANSTPIELHISNLDQNIDPMEMKKILLSIFGEHVMVLHVSVFVQSDGNFAASIKVPTIQDAQYAISQLHRRKIGYKRIVISYAHSTQPHNPQFIRWQIVSLLQDVPGFKLPLFKFLKMFESRYVTTISVSDLYRLKDVCVITDECVGRMVSLNPDHRNSPSPNFSSPQDVEPYCSRHYKVKSCFGKGWAEQEVPPLPNILVSLQEFTTNVHCLIATHNNALPLSSFIVCYEAECGLLLRSENGVPLEHLVTCINKVELSSANGVKYLKPAPNRNFLDDKIEDVSKCVSPSLVKQLTFFGRELVDLLRTQPHCQLLFNRLIPAYHHHFGRQCRVADYGFTKLIDLLDALPNIVQVIGEGNKRIVTLSHRAQIKRFTSDLLRALKSQPCKKLTFEELPLVFERVLGKSFDPVDYGLCSLYDLMNQVPESIVLVTKDQELTILSIPKREQTQEEIERTKQFAKEVVELLGHAPQCSIQFHQFIPAYHHHYGHQCRVADFGFSKLIELFEAIPHIVKLEDDSEGERLVTLTQKQKLLVVGEQMCDLVTPTYPPGLPLESLSSNFLWQYGYALKPETYGVESLESLISSVDTVKLEQNEYGKLVIPMEEALIKQIMAQVRKFLIHSEEGRMPLHKLVSCFSSFHALHLTPASLMKHLPDAIVVLIEGGVHIVELSPVYQVGRRLVQILNAHDGHMSLNALEVAYSRGGGSLADYPSLSAVLAVLPVIATVKGKSFKRHVLLNKDLAIKNDPTSNGKAVCRPSSASSILSGSSNLNSDDTNHSGSKWTASGPDPVVKLPEMETLPSNLLAAASSLISPCKGLLPPSARPPHPSQLPIPVYLSPKVEKLEVDKKGDLSPKEQEKQKTPNTALKRKLRLAAQFQTPIDLD